MLKICCKIKQEGSLVKHQISLSYNLYNTEHQIQLFKWEEEDYKGIKLKGQTSKELIILMNKATSTFYKQK